MRLFSLVGPTATGKTEIAVEILEHLHGRVISADARQVYRFLDIGTNKPDQTLRARVKFELIDVVSPELPYSAADYARDARRIVHELESAKAPFMLVGGSGLYLRALFAPFFAAPAIDPAVRASLERLTVSDLYGHLLEVDPPAAQRVHPNDRQRIIRALEVFETTGKPLSQLQKETATPPEFAPVYVGLELPRIILNRLIDERFDQMVRNGLVDEVRNLTKMGYGLATPALDAIGYHEILEFLESRLTLEAAIEIAKRRSRAYAKRQMTWFRHQPGIVWIDAQDRAKATAEVERRFLQYLAEIGMPQ